MKLTRVTTLALGATFVGALLAGTAANATDQNRWPTSKVGTPAPKVKGMPPELAKNLANFDDLDFRVYTNQQWQDLHKSHTKDVVVHWPDGHTTTGIEKHIEDLKYMWTFAPDNRIKEHPVRFGTAECRMDGRHGLAGGHIHEADGPSRWQDHPADRQGLSHSDGDDWTLEQATDHVRGVPVLGQR